MTDKSIFALKITGLELNNINAGDLGRLLDEFCKLLGREDVFFDSIYSGSTVARVYTPSELYDKKLTLLTTNTQKNHKSLSNIEKVIRSYARYFPEIDGKILASKVSANDDDMQTVYHIEHNKPQSHVFEQNESFTGKLLQPTHGKDDTDHFTILLANDKKVSVKLSKPLSMEIAPYLECLWDYSSLIKFSGKARYEMYGDSYQLNLKDFKATGFEVIENSTTPQSWVDEFVKFGDSGWQQLENPEKSWLEERYS